MKLLSIKLVTLTPLSIRSNRATMHTGTTVGYIAGNTLLGGLAAIHRLSYPSKKDEFEQLFLRGHIYYPNLYPAIVSNAIDNWQDIHYPVYPLPKTAQSCKLYSGLMYPESEGDKSHGVRDTLMDWALFKLSAETDANVRRFEPLHAFSKGKKCRICNEPMVHFSGYYRRNGSLKVMEATDGQEKHLQTRVGVNSEAIQEGVPYSQQVFDEGMSFCGAIQILDDSVVNAFKEFVSDVGTSGLVRIGAGRTRGMGKVSIEVIESREGVQERYTDFTARLQRFNTQLIENVAQWGLKDFQHNYFFAVTLHSPLLLSDEFLRYRGVIDAEVLKELLKLPLEGLEQVYQCASMKRIMGWQELWGMPRMNEYAIDTGSVFLFRCLAPPTQPVIDELFRLEEQGIGERRVEGFGRICISDPFHKEVEPN